MATSEVMRAYRVALDPTQAQRAALASHAGASRAAYNYHLATKMAAHRAWRQEVAWATYTDHVDLDPKDAETAAKKSVSKAKQSSCGSRRTWTPSRPSAPTRTTTGTPRSTGTP